MADEGASPASRRLAGPADGPQIVLKARVLVRRGREWLLEERTDEAGVFWRPVGGKVEFGERGREAAGREFTEETGFHLRQIRFRGLLEDMGTAGRGPWHEVTLMYEGTVAEAAIYEADAIALRETRGREFTAYWVSLEALTSSRRRLRPAGLLACLRDAAGEEEP